MIISLYTKVGVFSKRFQIVFRGYNHVSPKYIFSANSTIIKLVVWMLGFKCCEQLNFKYFLWKQIRKGHIFGYRVGTLMPFSKKVYQNR